MFTRKDAGPDLDLFLGCDVSEVHDEYWAGSDEQEDWAPSDDEPRRRRRRSVFDEPREEEKPPPPLPCITFSRSRVLLHNLRVLGYDLSKVAANDNAQERLATALEVALCQKRGLLVVEDIAAALGLPVDAVRTAANDLHAATRTG